MRLIEKVAKAIYEADREGGFDAEDPRTFWMASDSYWGPGVWDNWFKMADAAMMAMRVEDKQLPREGKGRERMMEWPRDMANDNRRMRKDLEEAHAEIERLTADQSVMRLREAERDQVILQKCAEIERLRARLKLAESALDTWDKHHDSLYWHTTVDVQAPIARCDKCGTDYTPGDRQSFCPHESR